MGLTGVVFVVGGAGAEICLSHPRKGVVELPGFAPPERSAGSSPASAGLRLGSRPVAPWLPKWLQSARPPLCAGRAPRCPVGLAGCCHPGAAWGAAGAEGASFPPSVQTPKC